MEELEDESQIPIKGGDLLRKGPVMANPSFFACHTIGHVYFILFYFYENGVIIIISIKIGEVVVLI